MRIRASALKHSIYCKTLYISYSYTGHSTMHTMQEAGKFVNYDHITFWVSNAKQAASYYITRLGFEPYAYRGLETGNRDVVYHVVKQNQIIFVFASALNPGNEEMGNYITLHGDGVKDVAFTVQHLNIIVERAKECGAKIVKDIWEECDEGGKVRFVKIQMFGDTTHTLVERAGYKGLFLPGYKPPLGDPHNSINILPDPKLDTIDHIATNQLHNEMEKVVQLYEKHLSFHRFWSIDDTQLHTRYSSLRSTVMTNWEETIKMAITEPVPGKRKSQIQEFIDYYGGPGVQHIAFTTTDIISAIRTLKERGQQFLSTPDSYYDLLREKLKTSKVNIIEDINILQKLKILVDYDDNGYILQIFTKNMEDRPTLFIEIIQRNNHSGFGAGNFKALFESIEIDQEARGNL